ncbi:MAG: MFS transporter [Solirubrobacteraceae bacterium]|nr:MFS transporter [Solirubrobacteraceae bacterium]
MVVLDATIVNIALPSAQADLGFSDASRQWVVTAYALAFGGLLLLGGRLSDLFGRKWTFIFGLLGFSVASAIGGSAPSFGVLVGARALQGAFAAILAPAALSILTTTFTEPSERGRAFAIYGAVSGGGAAVGLLLGGFLTEYLSWRWCLYVNLFIALPAAVAAYRLIGNVAHAAHAQLDIPGTILGCSGLFCLVYGFARAESDGWGATVTLAFLGAAVGLLVLFRFWLSRAPHPLVPPRIIDDRNRGGALITILMAGLGIFGVFLFLTYFLQRNLGFSPVQAGLAFLPMVVLIVLFSITSQRVLLPRLGPRIPIVAGMLSATAGMLYLSRLGVSSTYASGVLPGLLVLGAGFGMIFSTAINTATLGVIPEDAGVASALVSTCQQVGGAAGTALLSTIAATATAGFLASGSGDAAAAAIHGYTVAFDVSAAIFLAGALIGGVMLRAGRPRAGGQPDLAVH